MSVCYIIYSKKLNRYYTGLSTSEIKNRISKHNEHAYGLHRFTAKADDWEEFLTILCKNHSHAVLIEKHIKKMKSKKYIKNLKKYPEMVNNLLRKFNSNRLPR